VFNSFKKSGGLIGSLVVVAAVLPIVLFATLSEDLRLRSFANQIPELRIWTEPSEVVTKNGKEFSLKIYGEANDLDELIPQVEFSLEASEGIVADPVRIEYKTPFKGQVLLGTIKIRAEKAGDFTVGIQESSVFSKLPNLRVSTQGTKIYSQR